MGFRGLAGEVARNTAGVWKGIADALDPSGRPTGRRDHVDLTEAPPPPAGQPPAGPVHDESESLDQTGNRMLVPLDTWTRILEQIGNVHEAGQQLADARERAARAETENRFLREQLTELKARSKTVPRSSRPRSSSSPKARSEPAPVATPEGRVSRVRRRASAWLSP